jgi:hypothetical protein
VLKKIKGSSSSKKKVRVLQKSAKLSNSFKAAKTVGVQKKAVKKAPLVKSVKADPVVSVKATGAASLEKQWARAKKVWIRAIQAEIKHTSLILKQDIKTLATVEAGLQQTASASTVSRVKTLTAAAKTRAKKSSQAAKLQKMTMLKLQKKVGKAKVALTRLKQLLLKAQAMNKLISQFDKEWKVPAEVAKPKKAGKADKAVKLKNAPKSKTVSRRAKKMTDVLAVEVDMSKDEKAAETAAAAAA